MVVNQDSGEVIYQKNADAKASIASLTKLMTAMVVLDSGLDLTKKDRVIKFLNRINWKKNLHVRVCVSTPVALSLIIVRKGCIVIMLKHLYRNGEISDIYIYIYIYPDTKSVFFI